MKKLIVDLADRSYPILIGAGLYEELGKHLVKMGLSSKCMLVTNPTVDRLYGDQVRNCLSATGFDPVVAVIPDSESAKSLSVADRLYHDALTHGLDRKSPIIALGGGVVGDLAGFVAATYMRGVPFVQLPTTLLAQVDSSVGGKVAVNHPLGKNMIGCFYQPKLVLIDLITLQTLPLRELKAAMAEVVKYGIIQDRFFFEFLECNWSKILKRDQETLNHVIFRSCEIKARVVSQDEQEEGLRAILNFGHTIGHALETLTSYEVFRHGEAVAIGMVAAARMAVSMGMLEGVEARRIECLLQEIGLPTELPASITKESILKILSRDKKAIGDNITMVLPDSIGHVVIKSDLNCQTIAAIW